jgi:hypothetical protein
MSGASVQDEKLNENQSSRDKNVKKYRNFQYRVIFIRDLSRDKNEC